MYWFFDIRIGILDYLREGFPWLARPFKHTESNLFTHTFKYTDGTYYLRGVAVSPALHIFECRYRMLKYVHIRMIWLYYIHILYDIIIVYTYEAHISQDVFKCWDHLKIHQNAPHRPTPNPTLVINPSSCSCVPHRPNGPPI